MAILNGWRLTRRGVLFVAGIIVLAGLVFGGIYFVRERAEQARRAEAVKIAEQNLQDQSEGTGQSATETHPPAEETKDDQKESSGSSTDELPATGAELNHVVIITMLSLAGAFYVTSRRAARDL